MTPGPGRPAAPATSAGAGAWAGERPEPPPAILVADDQREDRIAMEVALADLGLEIVTVASGREALRRLLERDFALLLLDVHMPGLDGYDTAALVRARERTRDLPIIFLTAEHGGEHGVHKGYALGAVDFLFKPLVPEILRSKVRVFVDLALARRRIEVMAQVQAQRALVSEDRYRELMEQASDAIFLLDPEGRVVEANPRAERLLGRARPDLVGCRFLELVSPAEPGERPRTRLLVPSRFEAQAARADGGRCWVDVSLSPSRSAHALTLAIVRDVTAEREAREQVQRLNEDLERRVEARTRELKGLNAELKQVNAQLEGLNNELESFSYSVAHDLRAPLRSIIGHSDLLVEDGVGDLGPQHRSHLDAIRRATRHMDQLITDLLDLARVTRHELVVERVDLSELARRIGEELSRAESARPVRFAVEEGLEVHGDARLLRLALVNLISNAWKFTARRVQPVIEFGACEEGDSRVFHVRDNGIGFDMRNVEKLFHPFQRLHGSEWDGNGIGLALVRRILERHDGRIWAEAAPGQGASFFFTVRTPPVSGATIVSRTGVAALS